MTQPNPFAPAIARQMKLRLALTGAPGAGKTGTALRLAAFMLGGKAHGTWGAKLARRENGLARVAFIDTERRSATKYGSDFPSNVKTQAMFDVIDIPRNDQGAIDPKTITEYVKAAAANGYEFLIIDSFSHAWEGVLDTKEKLDKSGGANTKNQFTNWKEVNPLHYNLIEAVFSYPGHVICTMRQKTDTSLVMNEQTHKLEVKTFGLKAIQRDGVAYEFDIVGDMDLEGSTNRIHFGPKSRVTELKNMMFMDNPGAEMANILLGWLNSGEEALPEITREGFIEAMTLKGYVNEAAIGAAVTLNGVKGKPYAEMLALIPDAA